jgi:hypothetical protein
MPPSTPKSSTPKSTKQKKAEKCPEKPHGMARVQRTMLPILQILTNRVKDIMFMCARSPAHHVVHGRKTLQMHGFPIQTWENFNVP